MASKILTRYQTTDGSFFSSYVEAEAYQERLDKEQVFKDREEKILALLRELPRDTTPKKLIAYLVRNWDMF